ncbi:pyrimidine dimer DNA glycosylase/endonuclease V [Carboxylicivirga sp. M1479]|uniref:pyrimidine dimer DNA glycosylase/endonuclease V n=1 Tax=Carboxylicivirga sp. M1479 TaxID=2594476 RepID=UPI0011781A8C|nr:pyrimidine dimer DNA glycosylase/endonuclease V [Carboxylicivirga sp. M1479]TRX66551.1 hypothetical protein FNN09_12875 [Carboxylicivirga sp. M1479]
MRLWSLHPKYLDAKGLVALWRETLLAKNVLEGKTKAYRNHPQLKRFKKTDSPLDAINFYLQVIWEEATDRDYKFDKSKFVGIETTPVIPVTNGQVAFEVNHLLNKLKVRDTDKYNEHRFVVNYDVHPLFALLQGDIEAWEKI